MKYIIFLISIVVTGCKTYNKVPDIMNFKQLHIKTNDTYNMLKDYAILMKFRRLRKMSLLTYSSSEEYLQKYLSCLQIIFKEIKKGNAFLLYGMYDSGILSQYEYLAIFDRYVNYDNVSSNEFLLIAYNKLNKKQILKYCLNGNLLFCENLFQRIDKTFKNESDYKIFKILENYLLSIENNEYILARIFVNLGNKFINLKYKSKYERKFLSYCHWNRTDCFIYILRNDKNMNYILKSEQYNWLYLYLHHEYGGFNLFPGKKFRLLDKKASNFHLNKNYAKNFKHNKEIYFENKGCFPYDLYPNMIIIINNIVFNQNKINTKFTFKSIQDLCNTQIGRKHLICTKEMLARYNNCHKKHNPLPWLKNQESFDIAP